MKPRTSVDWTNHSKAVKLSIKVTVFFVVLVLLFLTYQWTKSVPPANVCDIVLDASKYTVHRSLNKWSPVSCGLHHYHLPDVVRCFDHKGIRSKLISRSKLRIAFMGDSRIRQQFYAFSNMLPTHDIEKYGFKTHMTKAHSDLYVRSRLLNSQVDFLWRHKLTEDTFRTLTNWTTRLDEFTPNVLIWGVGMHMVRDRDGLEQFKANLTRLEPIVRKLARTTEIIWWMNDPTTITEHQGHNDGALTNDHLAKLNAAAYEILRYSEVTFWDSSHRLTHEYLRSCKHFYRWDYFFHRRCDDGIHPGYLIQSEIVQILLNFLCNPLLTLPRNICCGGRSILPHSSTEISRNTEIRLV